jgi:zinc protease
MLSTIRKEEANPSARASRELRQRVFAGHPYGRPATGHTATVSKLTAADAQGFHRRHYTRANMTVSLVGDLTPEQAGALVDRAARHLPQGRALPPLAKAAPPFPQVFFVERNIPQTYLRMGHAGVDRRDPDFAAIQVMNYILGGGGFTSRLMQKIRTEEGLVYFVRSHFHPYHRGGMFEVEAQTRNETARRVVDLVRDQIRRLRAFGVEADEFQTAKDFLLGFHPLRTATTADLLSWMTILQMEGLGADYLNTWPERIRAVTREDVFRVANRLLDPAKLVVVSVGGKPAEGSQKAAE